MSGNIIFKLCRGCLTPDCFTKLSSLLDQNSETAEKLFEVTGIDVSCDFGANDAMMCGKCLAELDSACKFKIRNLEENYFSVARKSSMKVNIENKPENNFLGLKKVENDFKVSFSPKATKMNSGRTLRCSKRARGNENDLDPGSKDEQKPDENQNLGLSIPEVINEPNNVTDPDDFEKKFKDELEFTGNSYTTAGNEETVDTGSDPETTLKPEIAENTTGYSTGFKAPMVLEISREKRNKRRHSALELPVKKEENDKNLSRRETMNGKHLICEVEGCGKLFFNAASYKRHQISHSDLRAHVCHCGASFKHLCHLNRHQQYAHKKA